MSLGLLGKKLGMTHVYDEYGRRRAVTAVQAGPCTILALRETKPHGYRAVQVGFEPMKEKHVTKPRMGQFKKAGTGPFRHVREFRLTAADTAEFKVGQELTSEVFQQFEVVDVTGVSIGKGFQGGMKRWGWHGGNATHGGMQGREPGSIGSTTTPGRVIKGHHLPGHMGNDRVTIQNLRIARIMPEQHLILIEGAIPGSEQQLVMIRKSQKNPGVIRKPQALAAVIEDDENLSKTAKAASKKLKTPSASS